MTKSSGFRYDINALRAVAVVMVVLYHFNLEPFSSGFIGVDIFFVISGYLMTSIIDKGITNQRFSFTQFFVSRTQRIVPALVALCVMLVVYGWFFLLPIDFRQLAKHVISSQLFLSNIVFALESGYFDAASNQKLLLHTWSLSAEWQFYVLYPFLLVAAHKIVAAHHVKWLLIVLFVGSFCLMLSWEASTHVYFSLFSRAWEMLMGGIVFYLPLLKWPISVKRWLVRGLFAVVLLSGAFIGHSTLWPTPFALIPVCSVAAILWMNQSLPIFKFKPLHWLGDISYSLYLWHWPIAVILIYQATAPSVINVVTALVLSLLMAWLSYSLVENPTRGMKFNKRNLFISVGVFGGLGVVALSIFLTNGYPVHFRVPPDVAKADLEQLNREPRKDQCLTLDGTRSPHCIYGDDATSVALILFGDSHASALVSAVRDAMKPFGSVLFIAKAGCPSLIDGDVRKSDGGECRQFVSQQLQVIEAEYPHVPIMVVSRWPYYYLGGVERGTKEITINTQHFVSSFTRTWCPVAKQRTVFALTPVPEFESNVPKAVAHSLWNQEAQPTLSRLNVVHRSGWITDGLKISEQQCGIHVINVSNALCNNDICNIAKDNRPLYYDDNHLSEWGGVYLVPYFKKILFSEMLK